MQRDGEARSDDEFSDHQIYVWKNTDYYISQFKKFRNHDGDRFTITWNWPAFFIPEFWMLYRKLYSWAIVALILKFTLPLFSNIVWGATANYIYFNKASKEVRRINSIWEDDTSSIVLALSMLGGVNEGLIKVGIAAGIIAGAGMIGFIYWGLQ